MGGPLRRDRLWLFSGNPSIQSLDRTVTFYSDGSRGAFTRRDDLFNATGTMTAKLPRGTLRAAISAVRETQLGALPAQDGTSNPAANYGINTIRPAASAAVSMGYALNGRTFLSLRAGTFSSNSTTKASTRVTASSIKRRPSVSKGYPPRISSRATTATWR